MLLCAVGGKQEVDKETALGMCQATWKVVLNALSQLLARCSSEEIILHLLKVCSQQYAKVRVLYATFGSNKTREVINLWPTAKVYSQPTSLMVTTPGAGSY